jgi:hypothetical protein
MAHLVPNLPMVLHALLGELVLKVIIDNAADTGIVLRSKHCNVIVVNECKINECLVGIKLNGGAGQSITNNWVSDCPTSGIYILASNTSTSFMSWGVLISGNYIEEEVIMITQGPATQWLQSNLV